MVFDSGDGVSHSVPVFEGYCLAHAVQRSALAGADVTLHLRKVDLLSHLGSLPDLVALHSLPWKFRQQSQNVAVFFFFFSSWILFLKFQKKTCFDSSCTSGDVFEVVAGTRRRHEHVR